MPLALTLTLTLTLTLIPAQVINSAALSQRQSLWIIQRLCGHASLIYFETTVVLSLMHAFKLFIKD